MNLDNEEKVKRWGFPHVRSINNDKKKIKISSIKPKVHPKHMSDLDVSKRTGFKTVNDMLTYIAIVCNGDFDLIIQQMSVLTWFEEWMFFFELLKGKSFDWDSGEHEDRGYGICQKPLRKVFDNKLKIVVSCRNSWPLFALYKEDRKFVGNTKILEDFEGLRPVYWDMTNLTTPKPSDATLQRLTFSKYYNENCYKGGIGLQKCGWICLHDLWFGAVSDTAYQERSGILDLQDAYAVCDLVDGDKRPFTNILHKGYRIRLACWKKGMRHVLQPHFAKSDRKFTRKQTLSSAAIAANRAANERSVKYSKASGYVKRGLNQRQHWHRLQYACLAHGFQVNFMYLPVC